MYKIDYGDFIYEVDYDEMLYAIAEIWSREFADKEDRDVARAMFVSMMQEYKLLNIQGFINKMQPAIHSYFWESAMAEHRKGEIL